MHSTPSVYFKNKIPSTRRQKFVQKNLGKFCEHVYWSDIFPCTTKNYHIHQLMNADVFHFYCTENLVTEKETIMNREYYKTINCTNPEYSVNDYIRKELKKDKIDYYNTMNGDIYARFGGSYHKLLAVWRYGTEYTVYVQAGQMAA